MSLANCEVIAVLLHKKWNANNKDLARPVLLTEIVWEQGGEMTFAKLPVLISDPNLIKVAIGFLAGELLSIEGSLREDKENGIYLEANTICRVKPVQKEDGNSLQGRIALLSKEQRKNTVIVSGMFLGKTLRCDRATYSKGDLKKEDCFSISFQGESFTGNGFGMGSLKEEGGKLVIDLTYRMKGEVYG